MRRVAITTKLNGHNRCIWRYFNSPSTSHCPFLYHSLQVGAVLYPAAWWMPTWDEVAKESMPRAVNLFCYHILIDFMAVISIACGMSLIYGRPVSHRMIGDHIPMPPIERDEQHSHDDQMISPQEVTGPDGDEEENEREIWRNPTATDINGTC